MSYTASNVEGERQDEMRPVLVGGAASQVVAVNGPHLICVHRIVNLPLVSSSYDLASRMYRKVKYCSCITNSLCKGAEKTAQTAVTVVGFFQPIITINPMRCSINTFDYVMCAGLDLLETTIPAIKLPPQEIYDNSKKYVCDKCNSVKTCSVDCVNSVKKCGSDAVAEMNTISSCVKDTVRDTVSIITATSEDQRHLTHAGKQ